MKLSRERRPSSKSAVVSTPSRASSHVNSGLGRGLEGILGDAFVADADSGLRQLLGGQHAEPAREVRQFVADTAVGAIVAKFEAEAVWLATSDVSGSITLVSAHLPPGWSHISPVSLKITGHLWDALSKGNGCEQVSIADGYLWTCSQRLDSSFAVAVVRRELFDVDEQRTLRRFLRSVSVAIGGGRSRMTETDVSVSVQQGHKTATAEVIVSVETGQKTARAEASSAPLATAKAAAALCDIPCSVAYAGQVSLDRFAVNMVVVLDDADAPLIGLSVASGADLSGPARAVFASLASVSTELFGSIG